MQTQTIEMISLGIKIPYDVNAKFMVTVLGRISNKNKRGGFYEPANNLFT